MLDESADDLADLYTPDALREFPFTAPGSPPRYEDRVRATWTRPPPPLSETEHR